MRNKLKSTETGHEDIEIVKSIRIICAQARREHNAH